MLLLVFHILNLTSMSSGSKFGRECRLVAKLNGEKLVPLSNLDAKDVGLTPCAGARGEVGEIVLRGNASGVTSMLICSVDI